MFLEQDQQDQQEQRDQHAREQALGLDSFIVEAPAGAGKTELLTQRFLRLLAVVDDPEEVVALTFTNKAAGEMLDRIVASLALGREAQPSPELHKRRTQALARQALARSDERGWALDSQPGRLRVMTLDALCAGIARQMPFLSRFGSQPVLVDDASIHYAEAARRVLDQLDDQESLPAGTTHAEAIERALRYLDNDGPRLTSLLTKMLARRDQWRVLLRSGAAIYRIAEAFAPLVAEEMCRVGEVLTPDWQAGVMPSIRRAAAHRALQSGEHEGDVALRDWAVPLAAESDQLPLWRELTFYFLTNEGSLRKRLTIKEGFPPGAEFAKHKETFAAILAGMSAAEQQALLRLRELPVLDVDADAEAGADEILAALVQVLRLATAELWLVFRERGEVDFIELAMRAIAALGEDAAPTDLAQRLDYRISHLLVDEFQDTSPTQISLLERLTAGWQADDGRTLFLVGDPMQSIYRFRKADVGLFLRVAGQGIGDITLTPLRLYRNNRSCPQVVAWINQAFPAVLPAADDPLAGEVAYRSFMASRAELPDAGVAMHPVRVRDDTDGEGLSDHAVQAEASAVIDILRTTWAQDAQRQVAVLVRGREHLQALVAALRESGEGWRFSAVDIDPLLDRQVVQDLLALTRALHHRADRVHWLAILRAPWCGLTLADLHALVADRPQATLWSLMNDPLRRARLSADGQQRLTHVVGVLEPALLGQRRQSRRRWVADVWRQLGGADCCCDAADISDAEAYFDRLEALDTSGRFSLDQLEADMQRLYAAPDVRSDGRLQLMTIHKAKGLEFDTVIVMGLHRSLANGDTPLLAWDQALVEGEEQLLAAPMNVRARRGKSAGGKAVAPSPYDYLQQLESYRGSNEEARVLYVAATRAIRRLHLVAAVTEDESGACKSPRSNSLLARLWPLFEARMAMEGMPSAAMRQGMDVTVDAARLPLSEFVPRLLRLKQMPPLPPVPSLPSSLDTEDRAPSDAGVDLATGDGGLGMALAAAVGTLAHACMEQIASDPAQWPVASLSARIPAFEVWLRSRGWPSAEAQQGARRVEQLLAATLSSADGRWVLKPRPEAVSELAMTRVGAGGTAVTRVMDRSFVEDGVRWIIDYKTTMVSASGGAVEEDALAAMAERYRPQLLSYGELFAGECIPLRLAVLFLHCGRLIVLK